MEGSHKCMVRTNNHWLSSAPQPGMEAGRQVQEELQHLCRTRLPQLHRAFNAVVALTMAFLNGAYIYNVLHGLRLPPLNTQTWRIAYQCASIVPQGGRGRRPYNPDSDDNPFRAFYNAEWAPRLPGGARGLARPIPQLDRIAINSCLQNWSKTGAAQGGNHVAYNLGLRLGAIFTDLFVTVAIEHELLGNGASPAALKSWGRNTGELVAVFSPREGEADAAALQRLVDAVFRARPRKNCRLTAAVIRPQLEAKVQEVRQAFGALLPLEPGCKPRSGVAIESYLVPLIRLTAGLRPELASSPLPLCSLSLIAMPVSKLALPHLLLGTGKAAKRQLAMLRERAGGGSGTPQEDAAWLWPFIYGLVSPYRGHKEACYMDYSGSKQASMHFELLPLMEAEPGQPLTPAQQVENSRRQEIAQREQMLQQRKGSVRVRFAPGQQQQQQQQQQPAPPPPSPPQQGRHQQQQQGQQQGQPPLPQPPSVDGRRWRGGDPGASNRTLVWAQHAPEGAKGARAKRHDEAGLPSSGKLTKQEHQDLCGFKQTSKELAKHKAQPQWEAFRQQERALESGRTCALPQALAYLESLCAVLDDALAYYSLYRVQDIAFTRAIMKRRALQLEAQKAVSNIPCYARGKDRRICVTEPDGSVRVYRFSWFRANIIMCLGNANFRSRGAPAKALYRAIVATGVAVTFVPERRTSMLCNRCQRILDQPPVRGLGGSKRAPTYEVRRCKKCKSWWQRDINAALAMVFVARAMLLHCVEPGKYSQYFGYAYRRRYP